MFVSHLDDEFPFPPALMVPGTRHWRMVELTLDAPWFLLSVRVDAPDPREPSVTRTLCIAWERDLADALRSMQGGKVTGIVCMVPGRQTPTGQWSSRVIHEVWDCKSRRGQHIVLRDAAGKQFDCGFNPEHAGDVQMQLIHRIESPAVPT